MSTMTPVPPPSPLPMAPSGVPKVIGVLNIIFGSILIFFAICSGLSIAMQRVMAPMMQVQQNQMSQMVQANQEAQRTAQLRKLEQEEQAAQTDEDKQAIIVQRQAIESTPPAKAPVFPDMSKMYGMNDKRVIGFMITDMSLKIILNALLIFSGAGLVGAKEWSRKLAIGVNIAKLIGLFAMQTCNIVVVLPLMTKHMTEGMQDMMSQMPPGPGGAPPAEFGSQFALMMGTMMTAGAVFMIIFGSIYPAISLWFLTRPNVRATCQNPTAEMRGR